MAAKTDMDAIERLEALATEAADHLLLGDGAPHPDAALLDLCAAIARQREAEQAAWEAFGAVPPWQNPHERGRLLGEHQKVQHHLSVLLRRAGKIPATTAAGIFAKAIAVRESSSGSRTLCKSLADDLLNNPGLRAALWGRQPERAVETAANVVTLPSSRRRRA